MAVRLKHTLAKVPDHLRKMYFYDGFAVAKGGIIELPESKRAWIDRAYRLGYMLDPETGRKMTLAEVRLLSTKSTTPVAEPASAESEVKETDEQTSPEETPTVIEETTAEVADEAVESTEPEPAPATTESQSALL